MSLRDILLARKLFGGGGGGSGGTSDHRQLSHRNDASQHSIAAITGLAELIPTQASSSNQLADKDFVNSTVGTNTAYYISNDGDPFESLAELESYTGPLTNNDYAFVVGTDAAGNTTYTRYKYNSDTEEWASEYVLNNSSFTAVQWAAINSGVTAEAVAKALSALQSVADIPFASSESAGVAKIIPENGIGISSNGNLFINPATNAEIESKTNAKKPIVPSTVQKAVDVCMPSQTFVTMQTTAPASNSTDGGVHLVYLNAEPSTKYDGYIYLIKEA